MLAGGKTALTLLTEKSYLFKRWPGDHRVKTGDTPEIDEEVQGVQESKENGPAAGCRTKCSVAGRELLGLKFHFPDTAF